LLLRRVQIIELVFLFFQGTDFKINCLDLDLFIIQFIVDKLTQYFGMQLFSQLLKPYKSDCFAQLLFVFIIFFPACRALEYIPNSLNVPLFHEKNEFKSNISVFNYQLAYSVAEHWALAGNFFWRNQTNQGELFYHDYIYKTARTKIRDFELSAGYFTYNQNFVVELFAGGGYGSLSYSHKEESRASFLHYSYLLESRPMKFYVQSNFGYFDDDFELGLSVKFVSYQLSTINYYYFIDNFVEPKPYDFKINNNEKFTLYFIQPALTIRQGNDNVRFQLQCGLNQCMNYKDLNIGNVYIRMGIYFIIPFHE